MRLIEEARVCAEFYLTLLNISGSMLGSLLDTSSSMLGYYWTFAV